MKKLIFRNYAEVDAKKLEGYTISKVSEGINSDDSGLSIELERDIEGGTLGIQICYDPSDDSEGVEFAISEEYIKHVFEE